MVCRDKTATNFSRRNLIQLTGAGLGLSLVPEFGWANHDDASLAQQQGQDPHFFIMIHYNGGWDPACLWDARPEAMTAAKVMHPYGGAPTLWQDGNGGETLISAHGGALAQIRQDITIVNGVLMAQGFDGHEQNTNFIFTGNPFGGRSLLPLINPQYPLAFVQTDALFGSTFNNHQSSVYMDPEQAKSLSTAFKQASQAGPGIAWAKKFRDQQLAAGAQMPAGSWQRGAAAMQAAIPKALDLKTKIANLNLGPIDPEKPLENKVNLITQLFASGITSSIYMSPTISQQQDLDTHSGFDAAQQNVTYTQISEQLVSIISKLKSTPAILGGTGSLLDQTTVVITSEFGRTMRQVSTEITATGTDHNPLANSVILAGKGIRTGRIFGGSDYRSSNETLAKAHLQLDGQKIKIMGRPVDKQTGLPVSALPEEFILGHYLSYANIGNALMNLFSVDRKEYWNLTRNTQAEPFLPILV